MKNDNPNTKLIEVRNLVVAARRQLEKAANTFYGLFDGTGGAVPCPDTIIAILCETEKCERLLPEIAEEAEDLKFDCQCMRDIRQHDIELTQKDASDE